ncbi:hypothetical protein GON03_22550 [Nocardioides sp. MAH-18]|uniref:Gram-positive cocci surface proteins LPxTG domain-containing protein n=2 Tax=Nocardioides TaxID=1839 RepID=A0A6L6XXH9_9ACTN|nr:hypothetical protein [Nocardioides sp. MAH-18]MVQ51970.1 hypothetical protein [Nocardioides sp. MAH-18]
MATLMTLTCGPLAGAAFADPTGEPGHSGESHGASASAPGHAAPSQAPSQAATPAPAAPQGPAAAPSAGQDQGKAKGHAHAPGQAKPQPKAPGTGGDQGDKGRDKGRDKSGDKGTGATGNPPGNNGTVKIAGPADAVGHPSNNPHPGCILDVEWFGYDAGADVVSTVTFTPQAPTSDVTIGGTSPSQVFVGGDAAGGGTDLDGRQAYALTFSGGAPHPKQGYHVKLTVATPRSLGNDTKTKVFWVQPCAPVPATTGVTGDTGPAPTTGTGTEAGTVPGTNTATGTDTSTDTDTVRADTGAAGETATETSTESNTESNTEADTVPQTDTATGSTTGSTTGSSSDATDVPTAVDAGEEGALPEWARSPLALVLLAGGAVLVGAAFAARRTRA